jgi:hypothetical protein
VDTTPLTRWDSFYVIAGSSAAALTGLQFVVMALAAGGRRPASADTIGAFGTPNVMHFSAVLLVSAIMTAPWSSTEGAAIAVGACGLAGIVYGVIVARRARRQTEYQPVLEDWIFHAMLPLVAYSGLGLSALALSVHVERVLFAIGASSLLLLFVGIHNAWDTVAYIAIGEIEARKADNDASDEKS